MINFLKRLTKNSFRWVFSGNKKIFVAFFLFFIFIPLFSEALIGTGIFDLFSASLEGISEMTGPFKGIFVAIVFYLILSLLLLRFGVFLLDFASDPAKLEIIESEMVQIGWQFTSGLANTAIIIALIVIGIATILNQESYHAKKTLPKLIIVALLVNFSLVFVGIIVDISHIVLNTFFRVDIGSEIMDAIFAVGRDQITQFFTFIGVTMAALAVPFTAPLKQIVFVTGMTGFFLPQIITSILIILTSILLSGVMYLYALLFYARIFIIQILAILSPLAFVAWVLPATQSLFKKWVNALVGWAFLGVALFFFLLLSTIAVAPLRPEESVQFFTHGSIGTIFIYYVTLAIFLAIAGLLSKKMMPAGADALVKGVTSAAKGFKEKAAPITRLTRPAVNDMRAKAAERATEKKVEEKRKQMEQESGFGKLKAGAGYYTSWATRKASTARGRKPETILKEAQSEREDMWFKDASEKEIKGTLKSNRTPSYRKDQALEKLQDMGSDFSGVEEQLAKRWDSVSKEIKKEIEKVRPDIHLTVDPQNGEEKMKEAIDKMSGSDARGIKWDKMDDRAQGVAAGTVARDMSKLQSLGDANITIKNNFSEALSKTDDRKGVDNMGTYLNDPKAREKWDKEQIHSVAKAVNKFYTRNP